MKEETTVSYVEQNSRYYLQVTRTLGSKQLSISLDDLSDGGDGNRTPYSITIDEDSIPESLKHFFESVD